MNMDEKYYVIATDKFLSGWGQAEGGRSVIVIECQDEEQQYACEKAMSYDKGLKNIRTYYGKKPVIRNAAHVQYMDFLECPRWNQDYLFQHKAKNESKNTKKQVMLNENKLKAIVAEVLKGVLNERYGREFEKKYPAYAIFEYMDDIDDVYGKDDDWYEQVMPQLKEEYSVVWNSEESEDERGKFHDNTDFRMCQEFYDDIDKLQLEGWGGIKEDLKACGDVFIERNIDRLKEDADEVVDDYFAWDSFEDKEEW